MPTLTIKNSRKSRTFLQVREVPDGSLEYLGDLDNYKEMVEELLREPVPDLIIESDDENGYRRTVKEALYTKISTLKELYDYLVKKGFTCELREL